MIGIRLGKNEFEEAKRCCRRLMIVGIVVSLCITLISPLLMGMFRVGETVNGYLKIMIIMEFAVPLKFMNYLCIVGVLRIGGDSTYNQGTFIGASHLLYKITGEQAYLDRVVKAETAWANQNERGLMNTLWGEKTKDALCPDGLHPNDAGNVIIAERL